MDVNNNTDVLLKPGEDPLEVIANALSKTILTRANATAIIANKNYNFKNLDELEYILSTNGFEPYLRVQNNLDNNSLKLLNKHLKNQGFEEYKGESMMQKGKETTTYTILGALKYLQNKNLIKETNYS